MASRFFEATSTKEKTRALNKDAAETPIVPTNEFAAAIASFALTPRKKVSEIVRSLPLKRSASTLEGLASLTSPNSKPKLEVNFRKSSSSRQLGYAPPEIYAHLNHLADCIKPGLDILFCGINPGKKSATDGHHFAHPTNQFWRALHLSGLTDRLLSPSEDSSLPEKYNYGLTNIVARPSISSTELKSSEKVAAVPDLLGKIAKFRPRVVCFIGKEIAEAIATAIKLHRRPLQADTIRRSRGPVDPKPTFPNTEFRSPSRPKSKSRGPGYVSPLVEDTPGYRMMEYKMVYDDDTHADGVQETLFFTAPSTSGRVVNFQIEDRVQLFRMLQQDLKDVTQGLKDTSYYVPIPSLLYAKDQ